MKKIIDDKGNDNGPSSSKKKADSKFESPSKEHSLADKFDYGNNLGAKKSRSEEVSGRTKSTKLKHGSRRNLL